MEFCVWSNFRLPSFSNASQHLSGDSFETCSDCSYKNCVLNFSFILEMLVDQDLERWRSFRVILLELFMPLFSVRRTRREVGRDVTTSITGSFTTEVTSARRMYLTAKVARRRKRSRGDLHSILQTRPTNHPTSTDQVGPFTSSRAWWRWTLLLFQFSRKWLLLFVVECFRFVFQV